MIRANWKLGALHAMLLALCSCTASRSADSADASQHEGAATPDAGSLARDAGLHDGDGGTGARDSGHPPNAATLDGGTASWDASIPPRPMAALDGGDPRVPGLPDELQDELIAMCAAFHTARCAAARNSHPGAVDLEQCVAFNVAICTGVFLPRFAGAFREGRLVYDAEALATCLEEAQQQDAGNAPGRAWGWPPSDLESCHNVFTGTVANGDACYRPNTFNFLRAAECAEGLCVVDDRVMCPGVCKPYLELGDSCDVSSYPPCRPLTQCYEGRCVENAQLLPGSGEACTADDRRCYYGLTCAPDATGGYTCGPPRELGARCDVDANCARGACTNGTCQLAIAGAPCSADTACTEGLLCSGITGLCGPPEPDGGECGRTAECEADLLCLGGYGAGHCKEGGVGTFCCPPGTFDCGGGCREGLVCDQGGSCRAPGGVGDPCDFRDGRGVVTCLPDLLCSPSGTCEHPRPLGAPCIDELECGIEAYCDDGACTQRKGPGASCESHLECSGGGCDSGKCVGGCNDY